MNHIELKDFLDDQIYSEKCIAYSSVGDVRIDMITEIVDGGRSGIVPKTYFEVFERRVRVGKYNNLEDAVNDYNGRTGE